MIEIKQVKEKKKKATFREEINVQNNTLTIIGAGGTGHAMAAYFTQCGLDVCFCDTSAYKERMDDIRRQNGIKLVGNSGKNGIVMPKLITSDFQAAMCFSNRVFVCVPATRHVEIAKACAPFVTEQHIFCISPGNLGSPVFRRVFQSAGISEKTLVSELAGNLGSCRLIGPAEAVIALPMGEKKVAAYPASKTEEVISAFSDVIPMESATHIFEAALNSPNVVIHLPGSLLSATQVEKSGDGFCLFTDGMSDAAAACIAAVEKERDKLMEKLGFSVYESAAEFINEIRQPQEHPELDAFRKLDGPSSLQHRYICEDALAGDSLLLSLGDEYGVPMPVLRSFMMIACTINGTDFYGQGRTLRNLGLAGLSPEELKCKLLGSEPIV